MSATQPLVPSTTRSETFRPTTRRTPGKALQMWLRRGHLYLGLFLFPWALLYGVTAFLFNHPTWFTEQTSTPFGAAALAGTPLETPIDPQELAAQVVARLNELQKPEKPYALAGSARFSGREVAAVSVKRDEGSLNVLVDLKSRSGTIRVAQVRERQEPERAPFAVGGAPTGSPRREGRGSPGESPRGGTSRERERPRESILLESPLPEKVKASVPPLLEGLGMAGGIVTVTSMPELVFPIEAGDRIWTATYNFLTGGVQGTNPESRSENQLGWRRFLLRLHTAHGYPNEVNGRWFWAVIVDAMAFTMCFWGLSGLIMWWQIKVTRQVGAMVLVLSAVAAVTMGFLMHAAMTG